jgi:hypothetical protein
VIAAGPDVMTNDIQNRNWEGGIISVVRKISAENLNVFFGSHFSAGNTPSEEFARVMSQQRRKCNYYLGEHGWLLWRFNSLLSLSYEMASALRKGNDILNQMSAEASPKAH